MPRYSNQFRTAQLVDTAKTYRQGYHKGNTTGLDGVDADLATGNIKSGVTLFGVAGSASVLDVSDADAAIADVKNPKTFYSVTGPRKTGTMATVALNPAANAYPAGYHAGAASLTAVDADLAVGNIKNGVTIFGVLGTYVSTLAQDTSGLNTYALDIDSQAGGYAVENVGAGADLTVASVTPTFNANSIAIAVSFGSFNRQGTTMTARLYMGGVQMAESGNLPSGAGNRGPSVMVGFRALSGAQVCHLAIHNYDGVPSAMWIHGGGNNGTLGSGAAIGVGSIKLV